ncbi:mRNA decay protein [Coemansia sp. RSA 1933]|nr:mRNA decay protein [Coemansia sp. RSA 1933]
MKKNTGFIKKCKAGMCQESSAQLVREVKLLKLEKYVSELVPAVVEGLGKCRTNADFAAAIDVISALHSRFPVRFTVPLIKQLLKGLAPPVLTALAVMSPEQRERDEQARVARQKPLIRVVADMYLNGLLWGIDFLPGGVDGLDRSTAFMLTYPHSSSSSAASGSGTSSTKQILSKVKDMVQQPGHCVLVGVLQSLLLSDKEHHLSIVLATFFAKSFKADFAIGNGDSTDSPASSVVPFPDQSDSSGGTVVSADCCKQINTIMSDYSDSAISHLKSMHKTLTRMRNNNEEKLFNKGIIHAEVKEKLERHIKSFDRLSDSVRMFCEALGTEVPHFEESTSDESQLGIVFDDPAAAEAAKEAQSQSQWNNEEERVFYEYVLDLQSELPPSMLDVSRKKAVSKKDADAKKSLASGSPAPQSDDVDVQTNGNTSPLPADTPRKAAEDDEIIELEEIKEADINFCDQPETMAMDDIDDSGFDALNSAGILEYQRFVEQRKQNGDSSVTDYEDSENLEILHAEENEAGLENKVDGSPGDQPVVPEANSAESVPGLTDDSDGSTMTVVKQSGPSRDMMQTVAPMSFSAVLQRLSAFTSKEDADIAAVAFCYVNTRANREALVRALVDIRRQQLYIVPYYARFIAVLHRYFPEIGDSVVEELRRESVWLAKQRFKNLMDVHLKNTKYIAELTKFKVAPLYVAYCCAKTMLEQFHVHNIEVLCSLLEGCGRFLLAQPATSSRVSSVLDILIRKRRVLNLDERSSLLIENACYACMPQQRRKVATQKFRTPYELYIRKLVYEDLSRSTADFVCQKLRKLPWSQATGDDPQRIGHALLSCFSKIWKVKYSSIYLVTMVLGALGNTYPWFVVAVVDAAMERIKLGLDQNLFSRNQRRIAEMRYIGEMFVYSIVDFKDISDMLYLMLGHGHSEPHPYPGRSSGIDSSNDYFRIRLVCTLLSTCGKYVCNRSAEHHRELAKYAVYLQLYILAKDQPLPVDISYTVDSLFESVFASVPRYDTWNEAAQAMAAIIQSGDQQASLRSDEHAAFAEDILVVESLDGGPIADAAATSGIASNDYENSSGDGDDGEDDDDDGEDNAAAEMERMRAEEEEMEEARRQMEALEELLEQEEEDLLERELNKLVLDSSELRKSERSSNRLDVGIPMDLMGKSSASQRASATNLSAQGEASSDSYPRLESRDSDDDNENNTDPEDYDAIRFSLLTGKRQRPVVRDVAIPLESQIARNLRQQEEMAMREKAHLKNFVLRYQRREAEEEQLRYEQGQAARRASRTAAANTPRLPFTRKTQMTFFLLSGKQNDRQ